MKRRLSLTAVYLKVVCNIYADRVKTRCSAATSVLRVTKDHERYRVTPRIALIDRVGAISGATRSVQPARSDSQRDQIRHRWWASHPGAAFTAAINLPKVTRLSTRRR